ncbi:MAG: hypothetical protein IT454_01350 [Planctomycetes bacterium]|nr:hypothetical protein [Planctomycetota bacterium]
MQARSLCSLVAVTALAGSAWSQVNFDGTKQGFVWTGDCSSGVVFTNTSGVDLCDLWLEINDDGANNAPEIEVVTVQKGGGGADWDADDNEDGDDDDANENDDTDSSPNGNAKGWHRTQAVTNGDCIAPGANFTVTLCAAGGASLVGRNVYLWGTSHGNAGAVGGDGGVKIADPPKRLASVTPSSSSHLAHANLPGAPVFTLRLVNDDLGLPMNRVWIVPEDPDFDVLNVQADAPWSWDAVRHELSFSPPLAPADSAQVWLTLDHMSSAGPTTDVRFTRAGDPPQPYCTPKLSSAGCPPLIASFGNPSATSTGPFVVLCQQVVNQKVGLLFYGTSSHSAPFQGGTLCVGAPVRRTQLQSSGGSPIGNDCSGLYQYDFQARIQGGFDPQLVPGASIYSQWWFRDPQSPSTTGLSNGLHFVIDS